MPSHMPSSFASAAAGQSSNRDNRGAARGDNRGTVDWPRRENRGPNGTLTLRRSSTTPHGSSILSTHQTEPLPSSDMPLGQPRPYGDIENPSNAGIRYSKHKLLDIYREHISQVLPDQSSGDVSRLYVNNWEPGYLNGTNGRGWGKSTDSRDHNNGPDICWDQNGQVQPIGLEEMSVEEKLLFAGDINSPLKPPPQNISKDQNSSGPANGRKGSVSHGQGSSSVFGMASPTSTRPGTRRRETSDSIPYSSVTSPSGTGRFNREETSPFFARKGNDSRDPFGSYGLEEDGGAAPKVSSPFGGLMRSNTGGSTLGNGPGSPWGATVAPLSATHSPMGNFGNFAMPGNSGQPATPGEKRPGFGSMRGESRLAHLMPKESSEDLSGTRQSQETSRPWRSRPRTDTDPFGDDPMQSMNTGGRDLSSLLIQQRRDPGFDTPSRQVSGDLGMSEAPGFRDSAQRREQAHQTPQGHQGPGMNHLSPTDTNPYASPLADSTNDEDDDNSAIEDDTMHQMRGNPLVGIPEHVANHANLPRSFPGGPFDGSDRSQNSSAGASKGLSSLALGGIPGLGGWPSNGNPSGTPDRERPGYQGAFGNPIFGPMGDMQSPSLGNLGGSFGNASSGNLPGSGTAGRGSKLGSLFPAAMQAQMHGSENDQPVEIEQRQGSGFGAIGRNAFSGAARETDSPMRTGRAIFDELLPTPELRSTSSLAELSAAQTGTTSTYSQAPGLSYQQSQSSSDSTGNQMPQTQQRQMVMPDRMRWVYLDPSGQTQGPWSGLEMHDWYKAAFFTADLSVKKLEDSDFEPLGQLIRRIGNSREPFLVPQIGIPYGPPTTQAGAPFAPVATSTAPQSGSVQPPFAGAFPSFGTTLTAEQQNNLERRKQEEQYLMARQREFLAQQQVSMKQLQMQGLPAALHHHSSAHSLQSQPSFGSITSPVGMPPQAQMTSVSNFFDNGRQSGAPSNIGMQPDYVRDEELARLSLQDRQQTFGQGISVSQPSQLQSMFSPQTTEQRETARLEQNREADPQGYKARLREFEQLRAQHDLEQGMLAVSNLPGEPIVPPQLRPTVETLEDFKDSEGDVYETGEKKPLTLTEQVQKAASAIHSPTIQPESPWGKVATGLPMPFPAPPPQSTTPLPAPTAQRGRSNLPETLNMGTRSRSETPDQAGATLSIAPWAKEPAEAPKGPSLKEIQEVETKKAAKLEEAQAAARRALHEQEMRIQTVAPAPGLPISSTWGSTASPSATVGTPSAWTKPTATRAPMSGAGTSANKKTLADIQREEELRKVKLAAGITLTAIPGQSSGGKRYADLASKPTMAPATGSAWSTVGAGGKVKIPTGPAASMISARAVSNTIVPTLTSRVARPAVATRSTTTGGALSGSTGISAANQEFTKWAKDSLTKGLNPGINVDDFVRMLTELGAEPLVIAEAVYGNSQLMNGQRFAEEFLRRKKLAEKGVVEAASTSGAFSTIGESKNSGWSEVAKKGPPKVEEPAAGFKVVPNKKKGRK